jgi:hypothetical protein
MVFQGFKLQTSCFFGPFNWFLGFVALFWGAPIETMVFLQIFPIRVNERRFDACSLGVAEG